MNTVKAEELFKQAMGKQPGPKCEVVESGTAHDVETLSREVSGSITDAELEAWIKEQAGEVAMFERKQVDAAIELCKRIDADRSAQHARNIREREDLLDVDRAMVRLVRRSPPRIVRMPNDRNEMSWRISVRAGTRIEPYPRKDPRSSRSIAIENAKVSEQEVRVKKTSELLEELP
jgi:hypothetical protein